MAVRFKDYYATLGISRDATPEAIKKAYRQKARQWHPDVNKAAGAEAQFREANEAYEVLSDPEKRERYDRLGADWQAGAEFTPPPGFGGGRVHVGDLGDLQDLFGGARGGAQSGFSDFFESLFGDLGLGGIGQRQYSRGRSRAAARGHDIQAEIELTPLDLVQPGEKRIAVGIPVAGGGVERRTIPVNIPRGARPGQRLRLRAQGVAGEHGGPAGDIYLTIRVSARPPLAIEGDDLVSEADVPAPLAVVGGVARLETPEGPVSLRIAAGTQAGQMLRVRGRGLMRKDGSRGDLRARVRIVIPEQPTNEERALYAQLAALRPTEAQGENP